MPIEQKYSQKTVKPNIRQYPSSSAILYALLAAKHVVTVNIIAHIRS